MKKREEMRKRKASYEQKNLEQFGKKWENGKKWERKPFNYLTSEITLKLEEEMIIYGWLFGYFVMT